MSLYFTLKVCTECVQIIFLYNFLILYNYIYIYRRNLHSVKLWSYCSRFWCSGNDGSYCRYTQLKTVLILEKLSKIGVILKATSGDAVQEKTKASGKMDFDGNWNETFASALKIQKIDSHTDYKKRFPQLLPQPLWLIRTFLK